MSRPHAPRKDPLVSLARRPLAAALIGSALTLAACAIPASSEDDATSTATSAAASAASGKATAKHPARPAGITAEGILTVGSDIKAGTYRATVPADSVGCYWARLKGTSGQLEDIIANDNAVPRAIVVVTIKRTDRAFETNGCGTWVRSK